jgi:F-type H+-transporting ATPase subunit gamma
MLTNVLKSLVAAPIYDPKTGLSRSIPLLAQRPEEKHSADRGDRGQRGWRARSIPTLRRRQPVSGIEGQEHRHRSRRPQGTRLSCAGVIPSEVSGGARRTNPDHWRALGVLAKVEYEPGSEIADHIAKRYKNEEIDSVYLIFNEFKSVIAQRLIVQQNSSRRADWPAVKWRWQRR